jgi:hypothetical protein
VTNRNLSPATVTRQAFHENSCSPIDSSRQSIHLAEGLTAEDKRLFLGCPTAGTLPKTVAKFADRARRTRRVGCLCLWQRCGRKRSPGMSRVTHRRRFSTPRELRAVEFGADEIHARLEWHLRCRPQALRNVRARYRRFCVESLSRLERSR